MGRLFLGFCALFLPMLLLGVGGGLWGRRLWISLVIGLVTGSVYPVLLLLFGDGNRAIDKGSVFILLTFFMVPAALGSLVGHNIGLRSSQRRRLVLSASLCVVATIIFMMFSEALTSRRENSPRANCLSNLKQIGMALAMYADDNHDLLPPERGAKGLNYIYPKYVTTPKVFHCPKDAARGVLPPGKPLTEDTCSYAYVPGPWQSETNDVAIAWDKPENHGAQGLNVLFNDGHVSWLTLEEWEKIRPSK